MRKYLTTGEYFMIFAGAGLLVSLPFFTSGNMALWFVAKGFYLVGLVIMIIRKEWK